MNRKSRTSIAIAAAAVLIGAGATTVAHGVGTSASAKGASNVTQTTLADTTVNGSRTDGLDHSIANLFAEIDRLEAAIAAGKTVSSGTTYGDGSTAQGDKNADSTTAGPSDFASPETSETESPETESPETESPDPTSTTSSQHESDHQTSGPGGTETQKPEDPTHG
jgi:hypothetical protein